jgi:hypothetical protein
MEREHLFLVLALLVYLLLVWLDWLATARLRRPSAPRPRLRASYVRVHQRIVRSAKHRLMLSEGSSQRRGRGGRKKKVNTEGYACVMAFGAMSVATGMVTIDGLVAFGAIVDVSTQNGG